MLLIHCPYCDEDRPELEFRYAGEAHIARSTEMTELSDEAFEEFFFIRSNTRGLLYERWRHMHGCARFFNAVRNTVTDRFVMTYKAGEPRPDLDADGKPKPAKKPAAKRKAAPKKKTGGA